MTPKLPILTRLGFWRVKLGNRAQSDIRCGVTLALIGSSYDETDSRKATYMSTGRNTKTLIALEISIPPRSRINNGKSKGF
jgi:hypothetical protein